MYHYTTGARRLWETLYFGSFRAAYGAIQCKKGHSSWVISSAVFAGKEAHFQRYLRASGSEAHLPRQADGKKKMPSERPSGSSTER